MSCWSGIVVGHFFFPSVVEFCFDKQGFGSSCRHGVVRMHFQCPRMLCLRCADWGCVCCLQTWCDLPVVSQGRWLEIISSFKTFFFSVCYNSKQLSNVLFVKIFSNIFSPSVPSKLLNVKGKPGLHSCKLWPALRLSHKGYSNALVVSGIAQSKGAHHSCRPEQ